MIDNWNERAQELLKTIQKANTNGKKRIGHVRFFPRPYSQFVDEVFFTLDNDMGV